MRKPGTTGLRTAVSLAVLLVVLAIGSTPAVASGVFHARAFLRSYEEVPAVSSLAFGEFRLRITGHDDSDDVESDVDPNVAITWEFRYRGLETHVRFAHIHFAQRGVNGAIIVTLCSNADTAPPEVAECPEGSGEVTGTITAADVEGGGAAQGIAAGELRELLRAIRAGVTYVNLHTDAFPSGEMRGQLVSNYRRWLP